MLDEGIRGERGDNTRGVPTELCNAANKASWSAFTALLLLLLLLAVATAVPPWNAGRLNSDSV